MTDEAFANIKLTDLKDISFTLGHWLGDAKVLSQSEDKIELGTSSGLYATITKSGNTLTIQEANPYQAGVNETNIHAISELAFSYETDAATAGTDGTAKNGDTVTNTVSDNKGNSSSSSIDVGNRDQITKTFVKAEAAMRSITQTIPRRITRHCVGKSMLPPIRDFRRTARSWLT